MVALAGSVACIGSPTEPPTVSGGFDPPPTGPSWLTADYAVVVDPASGLARAWVRTALDPVPLDNLPPRTPDSRDRRLGGPAAHPQP